MTAPEQPYRLTPQEKMSTLKRRDRMVVFRLTQEEYSRLQEACSNTGARNISDYTREQLLTRATETGQVVEIEGKLSKFEKRLAELQASVRQISQTLKKMSSTNP